MPWSHLSHALVAGTGQSTAHSWLLWMFIFENYADPSLDRHRRLIGMRPGTRFFTYGMNGLEILLQMPTSTHGLPSLAKITGIWQNMLPVAWASVGSTFALLASFWHSTCGPSTKHLGFKTWCVLPICESWILERCGIGRQPMELTSWFVCRFLPHVNSSCVHIFTFGACALKRARLWRTGLTWPKNTWCDWWYFKFPSCTSCCNKFWADFSSAKSCWRSSIFVISFASMSVTPLLISSRIMVRKAPMVAALNYLNSTLLVVIASLIAISVIRVFGTSSAHDCFARASASRSGVPLGAARFVEGTISRSGKSVNFM